MSLEPQKSISSPSRKRSSFEDLGGVLVKKSSEQPLEQEESIPSAPQVDNISRFGKRTPPPRDFPPSEKEDEVVDLKEVQTAKNKYDHLGGVQVSSPLNNLFSEEGDLSSNEMDSFAKGIGTVLREGTADVLGLAGDIQGLADLAFDFSMEKIVGKEKLDEFRASEEERYLGGGLPTSEDIKGVLDDWTKGKFKPDNPLEKFIARLTSFLAFPGKFSLGRLASDVGAAAGGQIAEEMEAGPLVEFGATVAGGGLGAKALQKAGKGKALKPLVERVSEKSRQSLASAFLGKITPEIKTAAQAAKRQGIILPLTALSSKSVVKGTEKFLEKNIFGRDSFVSLAAEQKGVFLKNWEKNLDAISPIAISDPVIAGQLGKEASLLGERALKNTRDVAYEKVNDYISLAKEYKIPLTVSNVGVKTSLENLSKRLSSSLIPSATEKGVKGTFEEALDNIKRYQAAIEKDVIKKSIEEFAEKTLSPSGKKVLKAAKGKETVKEVTEAIKEVFELDPSSKSIGKDFISNMRHEVNSGKRKIDLETLISTERSLNDIIEWDTRGTSKQLVKNIKGKITGGINRFSKKNPGFGQLYKTAKEAHKDLATTAWNDLTKSMLTNQFPASQLKNLQNPEKFLVYKKLLEQTPEGKETFKMLRRFSLEDFIGKGVISSVEGDLKTGTFASKMRHKQHQQTLKNLLGPEAYNNAKDLGAIAKGVTAGAKDFLNPSQSGDVILLMRSLTHPISVVLEGVAFHKGISIPGLSAGAALVYGPKYLSKVMTNKTILKSARDAAAAGKNGNRKAYLEAITEFSSEIIKEIDSVRQAQATLQAIRTENKKEK